MRGASNPDGRTAALDCFASLAMTDRELAHLFLGVALAGQSNTGRALRTCVMLANASIQNTTTLEGFPA
jgi:hypothetical protein